MINLLELQALDVKIAERIQREQELPKQKEKFTIYRERLAEEIKKSEERCKKLQLEQRECAGEIETRQAQIKKYDSQLYSIKKNEEYKALLHEIDLLKKQIAIKEERTIALMCEYDEARAALEADKERIKGELGKIDAECAVIDQELAMLTDERKALQKTRPPLAAKVEHALLARYERVRKVRAPVVVPLNGEVCGGCFMAVRPQIVNEILANNTIHACQHCGRLLYHPTNIPAGENAAIMESA